MPNMTTQQVEEYYTNLLGPTEAEAMGGAVGTAGAAGAKGGIFKTLKKGAKRFGPEIIGWLLLEKYLSGRHESKMKNIQMDTLKEQAAMQTPENLYYQAALPQAQQEEEMARNALLTHLSGGVIGPTLARGERMIGG